MQHYLIVDPEKQAVTHYRRGRDGTLKRRILSKGALILRLPGIAAPVNDLFGTASR